MTFSSRQHVLVINSGSVFDTSMVQLLEPASDLAVVETTLDNEEEFLATVDDFTPSTIVINDSEQSQAAHLLKLLRDYQLTHRLRVLVIRMDDNTIDQYEFKQVVAVESADLVALIRSD